MPHKRKIGITHFPLSSEQASQEKVRPAGLTKSQRAGAKGGHRISRDQGPAMSAADRTVDGKGGKGGKSRGSRADLLARSRKGRTRSR
jgi:hypothetical protein